jgi:hypothetical protein
MSFQYQFDQCQQIAKAHDRIADDIDALAQTLPTSLDGGEGSEFILNGLAAIATAMGQLSAVQRSAATRLRTAVDIHKGIEDNVDDDFRALEEKVR